MYKGMLVALVMGLGAMGCMTVHVDAGVGAKAPGLDQDTGTELEARHVRASLSAAYPERLGVRAHGVADVKLTDACTEFVFAESSGWLACLDTDQLVEPGAWTLEESPDCHGDRCDTYAVYDPRGAH